MSINAIASRPQLSQRRTSITVRRDGDLVWPWLGMCAQVPLILILGKRTTWLLPASTLVLCGLAAAVILWRNPKDVWSPMPWFLLTSALFFGFGPMLHFFASPATIEYINGLYKVERDQLNRVFLLNAVGLSIVIGVYWLLRPKIRPARFLAQSSGGRGDYASLFRLSFGFGFIFQLVVNSGL